MPSPAPATRTLSEAENAALLRDLAQIQDWDDEYDEEDEWEEEEEDMPPGRRRGYTPHFQPFHYSGRCPIPSTVYRLRIDYVYTLYRHTLKSDFSEVK